MIFSGLQALLLFSLAVGLVSGNADLILTSPDADVKANAAPDSGFWTSGLSMVRQPVRQLRPMYTAKVSPYHNRGSNSRSRFALRMQQLMARLAHLKASSHLAKPRPSNVQSSVQSRRLTNVRSTQPGFLNMFTGSKSRKNR